MSGLLDWRCDIEADVRQVMRHVGLTDVSKPAMKMWVREFVRERLSRYRKQIRRYAGTPWAGEKMTSDEAEFVGAQFNLLLDVARKASK